MQITNKTWPPIKAYLSWNIHRLGIMALALLSLVTAPAALAQSHTITTLATFNGANGSGPNCTLTLSGNSLYGTTLGGGENHCGTVFSVPITGGTPTALASFNGKNGKNPQGNLILSDRTLYGTTYSGGAHGNGTLFSVPITGGKITVLVNFNAFYNPIFTPSGKFVTGKDAIGGIPDTGPTLRGDTLYGTTGLGGAHNGGTIYSIPNTGGKITILANFNYEVNGCIPSSGLTFSGKTLYGTTSMGGDADNDGIVFSMPITGGKITTLARFNGTNGKEPMGNLTQSGSTLYGTTYSGGSDNIGTVFSVPKTGGNITVLANFDYTHGAAPGGNLILSGKTLYGTTMYGGTYDKGVVFSVPTTGGNITVLANFDNSIENSHEGGLILIGTTLYGTTVGGGDNNRGTVFSVPTTGDHQ